MRNGQAVFLRRSVSAAAIMFGLAQLVHADPIPYPNSGSYNPTTYSFTATSNGDIVAYIVGGFSAGYTNQMGLLVNGVLTAAGFGLNNHASSVGQSFDLGPVNAGDTLTFVLEDLTLGDDAYSDAALNVGYDSAGVSGHNHIYSTAYTATSPIFAGVPSGTYVAFEDLRFPNSDFNYDDESFVFTNTSVSVASVPEPSTLLMVSSLLGGLAWMRRRKFA